MSCKTNAKEPGAMTSFKYDVGLINFYVHTGTACKNGSLACARSKLRVNSSPTIFLVRFLRRKKSLANAERNKVSVEKYGIVN